MLNRYLRPAKGENADRIWRQYADYSGKLSVRHFQHVSISAAGVGSDILPSPDLIIDDCDYYSRIIEGEKRGTHVAGRVLYGGFFRKQWGHFLMGTTSRLWPLFGSNSLEIDKVVFFMDPTDNIPLKGNYRELFELARIMDKVVILPPGNYSFDSLAVPDLGCEIAHHVSEEFMRMFRVVRDNALRQGRTPSRSGKLMLSRHSWKVKNSAEINVGAMDAFFAGNGYRVISPENHTLTELISFMNAASSVASYSGSLAHNLVFCDNRQKVIIERCAANNLYQIGIDKMSMESAVHVDAYYQPMLHGSTSPMSIYGLTAEMRRWAADNALAIDDAAKKAFLNPRREFKQYLKIFRRINGYAVGFNRWEQGEAESMAEAYHASYERYAPYLERRIPVIWFDYLSPRVWKKQLTQLKRSRTP